MTVQGGLKAGKISKPYGLQGDVHIILIPVVAQKLKPGNPLFIDLDGQRVPFFMESVDLHGPEQAIVKVEFISSVEDARKLAGCNVYIDGLENSELDSFTASPLHLIAYHVHDVNLGDIGVVDDHLPNKMNPVWVIRHEGREILVPATEDFIQKIDHKSKKLYLNLPEGMMEL